LPRAQDLLSKSSELSVTERKRYLEYADGAGKTPLCVAAENGWVDGVKLVRLDPASSLFCGCPDWLAAGRMTGAVGNRMPFSSQLASHGERLGRRPQAGAA
jgi:hypothetical protein